MRYTVLSNIIGEQYDSAIRDLEDFLRGDSEYPNFHERIHRFVNHSIDLVYAIKTKRNFAGINSLTRAKQQELFSKFKHHFYELQYMLKKIEKIQKDLKIEDVRSTIYVVKASWYATVSIAIVAVLLEIFGGLAITFSIVSDDFSTDLVSWMFSFF